MSVINCERMAEGATGSVSSELRRTYSHQYLVETNSDSDGQIAVEVGSQSASPHSIPAMWSVYNNVNGDGATDFGAFLLEKTIERYRPDEGNRRLWLVKCTWRPPEPGQDDQQPPNENPLLDPVKYRMEWIPFQRGIYKDKDDEPILNSAGDLFEGIEIDDPFPVLVAVRNMWPLQSVFDLATDFHGAVNNGVFFTKPVRTWRVESIAASDLQQRGGVQYYAVTIRCAFNKDKWDLQIVDRGTQAYLDPNDKKSKSPVRVLEGANAGDLLDMANLNSDGTQKVPDAIPPGEIKQPHFRVYPEKDFADLGIGGT